eukprot:TRINITY_DN1374_c0_g1_i1.p2 TRINITY_DN1374_c0_g1~~TRINITY_DN1374_c0_g1_i1.p2  ORF type:complete len:105 (+),score=5.84 TRINITY_DN1374_c0_g1_i1:1113-1427(+)
MLGCMLMHNSVRRCHLQTQRYRTLAATGRTKARKSQALVNLMMIAAYLPNVNQKLQALVMHVCCSAQCSIDQRDITHSGAAAVHEEHGIYDGKCCADEVCMLYD